MSTKTSAAVVLATAGFVQAESIQFQHNRGSITYTIVSDLKRGFFNRNIPAQIGMEIVGDGDCGYDRLTIRIQAEGFLKDEPVTVTTGEGELLNIYASIPQSFVFNLDDNFKNIESPRWTMTVEDGQYHCFRSQTEIDASELRIPDFSVRDGLLVGNRGHLNTNAPVALTQAARDQVMKAIRIEDPYGVQELKDSGLVVDCHFLKCRKKTTVDNVESNVRDWLDNFRYTIRSLRPCDEEILDSTHSLGERNSGWSARREI